MVVRDEDEAVKILQERQNSLYYCNCVCGSRCFNRKICTTAYMDILEDKRQLCIRKWDGENSVPDLFRDMIT